jgi:beta-1,4-mannosyl-glycoprotein beta-1,4-N-acetylglucosaminyltransferase
MINKHKIIDAFLFYNELDMLEFRLTELNEHVDYFIVLESSFDFNGNKKESVFNSNRERFDFWKEKIIHIDCPELTSGIIEKTKKGYRPFSTEVENYEINKDNIVFYMTLKLNDLLNSFNIDFEDIVMVSDVDEIPDFNNLDSLLDLLVFDSVFLRQKRFFWTTKYVDKDLSYGTSIHQYTKILQNPLMLSGYYKTKSSKQFSNQTSIDSGWHFSHFEDIGKLHEKLELINSQSYSLKDLKIKMNNLIPIKHSDLTNEYCLIDYDGNLPINSHLLPEQPVRRNWKRNVLIKTENITSNDENYSETIVVSFVDSLIKKLNNHSILLPQKILYGDSEKITEFQMEYGYNELKKIIKNLYLLNNDTITFDFGEPKTFTWLEIKNEYIADLL